MVEEYLNRFMDIYLLNKNKKTDKSSEEHSLICSKIPNLLQKKYVNYYIKGSEGNGNKTQYPWICLMDENITRSPQKGLYIAILFQSNMEGFYITLEQGITFFKDTFKSKAYEKAQETAKYFRNRIQFEDMVESIDLKSQKRDNGYGFEQTTIVGKYFKKNMFTNEEFYKTLEAFVNFYSEIIDVINGDSYEILIPKILGEESLQMEDAEKAIEDINKVLFQGGKPISPRLIEVAPKVDRLTKYRDIATPSNKKIDYVKRAEENAKTGLLGEKLILSFEIDRLNKLGLEEYAKKIKQVSLINDLLGYDIKSYDIDENGKIHEIYIEVKTSSTPKDVDFYVSRNEVEQSKKLSKNYWLYRVYNCNFTSTEPKFYRVNGSIEDNFILNADTYKATLKKDAAIVSSASQINKKIYDDLNEYKK